MKLTSIYLILLFASSETATYFATKSEWYGVFFALAGGFGAQLNNGRSKKITFLDFCAEMFLAGLGGYVTHAICVNVLDIDAIGLIRSCCIAVGFGGATGFKKIITYLPTNKSGGKDE